MLVMGGRTGPRVRCQHNRQVCMTEAAGPLIPLSTLCPPEDSSSEGCQCARSCVSLNYTEMPSIPAFLGGWEVGGAEGKD